MQIVHISCRVLHIPPVDQSQAETTTARECFSLAQYRSATFPLVGIRIFPIISHHRRGPPLLYSTQPQPKPTTPHLSSIYPLNKLRTIFIGSPNLMMIGEHVFPKSSADINSDAQAESIIISHCDLQSNEAT